MPGLDRLKVFCLKVFAPFIVAFSFLSAVPLPAFLLRSPLVWSEDNQGRSLLWYPLVGALLALFLILMVITLPNHFPSLLNATLLVLAWVLMTGALHLDGLADCIDAAYAAHRAVDESSRKKNSASSIQRSCCWTYGGTCFGIGYFFKGGFIIGFNGSDFFGASRRLNLIAYSGHCIIFDNSLCPFKRNRVCISGEAA